MRVIREHSPLAPARLRVVEAWSTSLVTMTPPSVQPGEARATAKDHWGPFVGPDRSPDPWPQERVRAMRLMGHALAPFSPEQVRNIASYQANPFVHPLTCGSGLDHPPLVPTEAGLRCTGCLYLKMWVPGFIADHDFSKLEFRFDPPAVVEWD